MNIIKTEIEGVFIIEETKHTELEKREEAKEEKKNQEDENRFGGMFKF